MDNEEFNKLCEELRAQGMDDEDILGTVLEMFKKGEIDADDMGKLAGTLGYELTDEFLAENAPAPAAPEGAPSEDQVEAAQEAPAEGDSPLDEDAQDNEEGTPSEDDEDEDDEAEKEEARKLFNLD